MNPFNLICYMVLMDHHHQGFENANPNYLLEKSYILTGLEIDALGHLDQENQARVKQWCKLWNYPVPGRTS
jgi:hypothetical protein